jgi:hypothetical protein
LADDSNERPPYTNSVLYTADDAEQISFAATFEADPEPAGAATPVPDSTSSPDTLVIPAAPPIPPLRQPHIAIPIASGAAAGFVLGVGLGYLGALIADQTSESSDDLAAIGGAALGFSIGEPLGVALGTHWGNESLGSFGSDLAISFAGFFVGGGIAAALEVPGVVLGAALQLGATTWIERRTAQKKYEKRMGTASP